MPLRKKEGIDFAVVTPDDPLVLGMADAMEEAGPPLSQQKSGQIEGSKVFAKNLMKNTAFPPQNMRCSTILAK